MSAPFNNLDGADALRAFRLAMGLPLSRSPDICVEALEDSKSTALTDLSAEAAEQEGSLPYREITDSPHAKVILERRKGSGVLVSSRTRASREPQSARLAETPDYASVQAREAFSRAPNTSYMREEVGNTSASNTTVRSSVGTNSSPRPVDESPEVRSFDLQQAIPVPCHRFGYSSAVEHVLKSPEGAMRVPHNSPATMLSHLSSKPQAPEDNLTMDEAHDCVIDIARELAALSERVQARKLAMSKSRNTLLHCRQSSAPSATSPNMSEAHTESQPVITRTELIGPVCPPSMQTTLTSAGSTGPTESFVLPHLRTPKQRDDTTSKAPLPQENMLLPHLRGLKPNYKTLSAINSRDSRTRFSDSEETPGIPHQFKQQQVFPATPALDALSKVTLIGKSDQGPSEPVADVREEFGSDQNKQRLQAASTESLVQSNIIASRHRDESTITRPASVLSSNSLGLRGSIHGNENLPLKAGYASSFLDKWGPQSKTSSPKASTACIKEPEDLENQLIFKSWPGQIARSRLSAQIRTCHLKNLPSSSTPAIICSVVFGGALERLQVHYVPDTGVTTATVRFLSGDGCKRFYDGTANGLPFKSRPGSREVVAWVTLGKEVDVIGGLLAQQIEQGVTRCVRAVPVDAELEANDLTRLAVEKGRQLEGSEDGVTPNGSRFVVWRFCDVTDAVAFRGILARKEEFESCNVHFSEDPCALRVAPDV